MGPWGFCYMGAPGKWPYMFAYDAGDENNMGEDSVASILGKTNHKGCSGRLLAAGQSLSRSRLWAWDDFWLLFIDLSFLKSATCKSGRENNSVLVAPNHPPPIRWLADAISSHQEKEAVQLCLLVQCTPTSLLILLYPDGERKGKESSQG